MKPTHSSRWLRGVLSAALIFGLTACDDEEGGGGGEAGMGGEVGGAGGEPMGGEAGGAGGEPMGGEGGAMGGEGGAMGGAGGEPMGGMTGGAGGEPMGGEGGMAETPTCPPSNYGQLDWPKTVTPGDAVTHTPRSVWTGAEWGVAWTQSVPDEELDAVYFGRFDAMGNLVGDPLALGRIQTPSYEVISTGNGYAVAWMHRRTPMDAFEGIRIQLIDPMGMPFGSASEVSGSFNAEQLALGWAPGVGGVLMFSRGRLGTGGLFAVPVAPNGDLGDEVQLSAEAARSPAVEYGNGNWGAVWYTPAVPAEEIPSTLIFQLLNEEDATPIERNGELKRVEVAEDVSGQNHIAYGNDIFGVGWSMQTPEGNLSPRLTLLDSEGDVLASPVVSGPMGYAVLTDVTWMDPQFFGVAWQDSPQGEGIRLGFSRLTTNGVSPDFYVMEYDREGRGESLSVSGNLSRLGAFFTFDEDPQPVGLSSSARVTFSTLGVCMP